MVQVFKPQEHSNRFDGYRGVPGENGFRYGRIHGSTVVNDEVTEKCSDGDWKFTHLGVNYNNDGLEIVADAWNDLGMVFLGVTINRDDDEVR